MLVLLVIILIAQLSIFISSQNCDTSTVAKFKFDLIYIQTPPPYLANMYLLFLNINQELTIYRL
jgi:hypothetical protein